MDSAGKPYISYTVKQLKAYCRENGIGGYSSMSKLKLVDLIKQSASMKVQQKSNKNENVKNNDTFTALLYDTDSDDEEEEKCIEIVEEDPIKLLEYTFKKHWF